MTSRAAQMLLPSLLISLSACDPDPIYEPTCEDGPAAPLGDLDPVVGEDGATFSATDEQALSADADWDMSPHGAVAADGSVWVSWFSWEASGIVFRLQRLDPSGAPSFGDEGLLVSDHPQASWVMDHALLVAEDGDAIVVFADERGGVRDLFAYRVSPAGEQRWGEDGVALSSGDDGEEGTPSATLLSDGDLAVAWDHDGGREDVSTVRVQRLTAEGAPRWEAALELACEPGYCASPQLAPLDGNDLGVVWMEGSEFMTDDRDVRATRLDVDGCPVWEQDPVLDGADGVPYFKDATVVAEPGGLWVGWTALADGGRPTTRVQRLSDDGALAFGEDALSATEASSELQFDPVMAWDEAAGQLVVAWLQTNSAQSRYSVLAQRVDAEGALGWGEEGLTIQALSADYVTPVAVRAWGDRALLFLEDYAAGGAFTGAQPRELLLTLDAQGELARSTLSETASLKAAVRVSQTSAAGRLVLSWADERADDGDVYLATVDAE